MFSFIVGINTKVVQVVANQLGIDISMIQCKATSTEKVVNGGVTGGSGTSEVICQAAVNACTVLNDRIAPYKTNSRAKAGVKIGRDDWIKCLSGVPSDVSLNVEGWYSPITNPNGQAFQYFVYGACVSEIELNVITGETHVLSVDITYDCGQSLNPAVDIGQIEGGFVMGVGYFLQEEIQYDPKTASLKNIGTWEYKPPNVQDVPSIFNVTLMKNVYNNSGILGSKATGEPPYILANSVFFATKMAVDAARWNIAYLNGITSPLPYVSYPAPFTIDKRQQACMSESTIYNYVLPY